MRLLKYDVFAALLDALCAEWMESHPPSDIRLDIEKVKLLREAAENVRAVDLNKNTHTFFREVFLRDLWSDRGDAPS